MTTVIYHSADYDGIFCREIARKFLPPDTEFIGWNFGDPPILVPVDTVYVMDLPLDRPFGRERPIDPSECKQLIWIDHHATSIETHPHGIPGYRIDGVAACRLAWQWFNVLTPTVDRVAPCCGYKCPDNLPWVIQWNFGNKLVQCHNCGNISLPEGSGRFHDRMIAEPLAVRLAGEYDVWDHRGDGDLELQYGLRGLGEREINFALLLDSESYLPVQRVEYLEKLISNGAVAMAYSLKMDAMWLAESWHIIEWEGVKFLAQNSVQRGSGILDSKDVPGTGHDALMLYGFRGKVWTISMYHAKHRKDLDLSKIAKKYGGGGHKGACGFTCDKLLFM